MCPTGIHHCINFYTVSSNILIPRKMGDCLLSLGAYSALMVIVLAAAANAAGSWSWVMSGYASAGLVCLWILCTLNMTFVSWLLIAAPLLTVIVLLVITQARWWAFELHHVPGGASCNIVSTEDNDSCGCDTAPAPSSKRCDQC